VGSPSFDVFISYARSVSTPLAIDLQRELERFAKKWNQVRAVRVFRDDSSMSANAGLWSTIESALSSARYFILIVTPESAASEYVNNEVLWWLENKSVETIMLVLADGQLLWNTASSGFTADSAVPSALRQAYPEEPRWIDMTWYSQPASAGSADPRFQERVADLAAPVRGVDRDALIGANLAEHRKTMRRARIAIATLAALLVAALVAGGVAVAQRNTAKRLFADAVGQRVAPEAARILNGELPGGLGRGLQEMLAAQKLKASPDAGAYLNAMVAAADVEKIAIMQPTGAAVAGNRIATRSAEHPEDIQVWDTDLNRIGAPIRTGNDSFPRAFSHDGNLLAVGNDGGLVELWDLNTRTQKGSIQLPASNSGEGSSVTNVIFSPDDTALVIRSLDNTVRFYRTESLQQSAPEIRDTAWILAPPAGTVIAVAPLRGSDVQIRDPLTGGVVGEPLPVSGKLFFNDCRSFDQAGNRLLVNSELHDVPARKLIGKSVAYIGDCADRNVALSSDGKLVLEGGDSVRLTDALKSPDTRDLQTPATLLASGGPFRAVAWTGDRHAVVFSPGGLLRIAVDPLKSMALRFASQVAFGEAQGDMAVQQATTVVGYRGNTAFGPIPGRLAGARGEFFYTVDPQSGSWDEWSFRDGSRTRGLSLLSDGDTGVFNLIGDSGLQHIVAHTNQARTRGGTLRRWDVSTGSPIGTALRVPDDIEFVKILNIDGATLTALTRDATKANDGGSVWSFDLDSETSSSQHTFAEPVTTAAMCRGSDGAPTWMIAEKSGAIGFAKGPLTRTIQWSHPPSVLHEGFRSGDLMLSDDCRSAASWATEGTLQFWDVDSGRPLGNPIPNGQILGGKDDQIVFNTGAGGVSGFRMMPERPTAGDVCAKLTANPSRRQWNEWVSPDINYQKVCPELPVPSDG
jgi:WD40 repeat protein